MCLSHRYCLNSPLISRDQVALARHNKHVLRSCDMCPVQGPIHIGHSITASIRNTACEIFAGDLQTLR